MRILLGLMKVQDYQNKTFRIINRKGQDDVELSDKFYEYLENLDPVSRSEVKSHLEDYLENGPIDDITITFKSNVDEYTTINKVVYDRLNKYIDADRRIVRIKFEFYNALERCTYQCKDICGDYLLIPAYCKTSNEELAAIAWCREIIKALVKGAYNKYGTELSASEALRRLEINI